jgi:hypothetical protein
LKEFDNMMLLNDSMSSIWVHWVMIQCQTSSWVPICAWSCHFLGYSWQEVFKLLHTLYAYALCVTKHMFCTDSETFSYKVFDLLFLPLLFFCLLFYSLVSIQNNQDSGILLTNRLSQITSQCQINKDQHQDDKWFRAKWRSGVSPQISFFDHWNLNDANSS